VPAPVTWLRNPLDALGVFVRDNAERAHHQPPALEYRVDCERFATCDEVLPDF
jgi:hypothetical protein